MSDTGFLKKKRSGRLDKRWDFDAQSNLSSAPLIMDIDNDGQKEIIFGTKQGKLFVLSADARIKWFYDSNEKIEGVESWFIDKENSSSIGASPSAGDINDDDMQEIVFGTELGMIYTLDMNGKLLWKYKAGGPIRGQIIIYDLYEDDDPKIIFGCDDKRIYVLNSKGKLVWYFDAGSAVQSTPGILHKDKPRIVFGCDDGSVFCLDKKGDMLCKYKTGAKIFATPVFANLTNDDRISIIIGSTDNRLYALDDAGELLWNFKTEGAILSKASVADINNDKKPEIVFGSCDNKVYALTHEGDKIWSYETDFWIVSDPILEDIDNDGRKEVIIGSYDHNLYVLDSEGSYILDYVPGLSGVVQQAGNYSDIITREPGNVTGKKIWQFKAEGIIVGCAYHPDNNSVIICTKPGKINNIIHRSD